MRQVFESCRWYTCSELAVCPLTDVSPVKMLRSARMAAMTGCTAAPEHSTKVS
jgi:hypothetical protein